MYEMCKAGWSATYWGWSDLHGVNTEATYPYEDRIGRLGDCGVNWETRQRHLRADMTTIKYIEYDPRVSMVHRLLDELENGPIACTMHVTQPCWLYYKSGVVESEVCDESSDFDHFMTLVGFHHAVIEGTGTEITIGAGDEMDYNRTCRWATDAERFADRCFNDSETMAPSESGEEDRKCCSYEPMVPITDVYGQEFDMSKSYWIAQNSFSKWWGDHGLVYIAAEEGPGVSLWN